MTMIAYSFINPNGRMYVVATNVPITVGTDTTNNITTVFDVKTLIVFHAIVGLFFLLNLELDISMLFAPWTF